MTSRNRWNESAGRVSRSFDDWRLADRECRWFMDLTLRLSRAYFDEVWHEIATGPASEDGDEMVRHFERQVGGSTTLAYEQMVLAAAIKDSATAFEMYVESARVEIMGAHGLSVAGKAVAWSRELKPFIKATLGVPVPREVSDVLRLRHALTHARGELRDEDDRRKFALGILADRVELSEDSVRQATDALASFVRELDPITWSVTWAGERLPTLGGSDASLRR